MLRVVLGIVFFAHGAQKMLGWFGGYGFSGTMGFFTKRGYPRSARFPGHLRRVFRRTRPDSWSFSRIAAFGIGVNMLVAIAAVHGDSGCSRTGRGPKRAKGTNTTCLRIAIAVAIIVRGAGALSLDRAIYRLLG